MFNGRRVSMVLGGGGLKGLAHIGVLKVFADYGIVPDEYIGTSVGSIVAALAAAGLDPGEIERTALSIRRSDILDYDWRGLILRRGRARSLYKGQALRAWIKRVLPVERFDQLTTPAYFTAVDVTNSREIVWGGPESRHESLAERVAASCAIPGIYPPVEIDGRHFVDGTLVDTLPVRVATAGPSDLILAVYLDEIEVMTPDAVRALGIGGLLEHTQSIVSLNLLALRLHHFSRAPVTVITPRLRNHRMFQFDRTHEVIRAGEEAALRAIATEPSLAAARPVVRVRPGEMKRAEDGFAVPGPEGLPEGGAVTSTS